MKKIKVGCIGVSHRGRAYLNEMVKYPDVFEITALCDLSPVKLGYASMYGVKEENKFFDEDEFFKQKLDLIIVATQDQQHVGHAIKALRSGADVLCEKPISNRLEEIKKLLKVQKETGKNVFICHVMRYAPGFQMIKKMLEEGKIGRLIMIDSIEQVSIFHYLHAYVRGPYKKESTSSPMIIAKCCHDLDLLTWFAESRCKSISSLGELTFFKKENQPEGAANRCTDCKFKNDCDYSSVRIYEKNRYNLRTHITNVEPVTDEAVRESLLTTDFGLCAFNAGNDVVDHQVCTMTFENGVIANLRMMGFVRWGGRTTTFFGTKGELYLNEEKKFLEIKLYSEPETEIIPLKDLLSGVYLHGGGDFGIIKAISEFYKYGKSKDLATLENAVESHLMGFAAEESRHNGGKVVEIQHEE